jgi:oligoribonuclease
MFPDKVGIIQSMEIRKNAASTKLLWVDLEMTGLDPSEHTIIEVAAVVTDWSFKTLATYEAVVKQSEEVLERSNPWAHEQHTRSGLLERVRTEGLPEQQVIQELGKLIREQFGDEPAVLAGNSIHSDRTFIKKWWPDVDALLHYRMLDVSSWKLVLQNKYGVAFEKGDDHRALGDIQASIAELEYYLAWFKDHTA